MDLSFCQYYIGDGTPPTNRYCRECLKSYIACDDLWKLVINLANSNAGKTVSLHGTNAVLLPQIMRKWGKKIKDKIPKGHRV